MQKTKSILLLFMLSLFIIPNCDCQPEPAPYIEPWEELNKDLVTFVKTMFTDWVKLKFTKDEQADILVMAKEWKSMADAQEKMKTYCGKAGFKVKFFDRTVFRDALWADKWKQVYEKACSKVVGDDNYLGGLILILRIGLNGAIAKVVNGEIITAQTQPETKGGWK